MNIDCLYPWSCPVFYVLISRIDMATSASLFLFFDFELSLKPDSELSEETASHSSFLDNSTVIKVVGIEPTWCL